MTTAIPDQPVDYTNDDFATSTERVRAARDRLLQDPRATEAHRALGEEISERRQVR